MREAGSCRALGPLFLVADFLQISGKLACPLGGAVLLENDLLRCTPERMSLGLLHPERSGDIIGAVRDDDGLAIREQIIQPLPTIRNDRGRAGCSLEKTDAG